MSAGLIYRYFENKNALILAIVDRQLQLLREDIRLNRRIDLAAEMVQNYGRSCSAEAKGMNAALLLEMSAEATRDPQIAAALDRYDVTIRAALVDWMTQDKQAGGRSDERSVGKECVSKCRSRWSPCH